MKSTLLIMLMLLPCVASAAKFSDTVSDAENLVLKFSSQRDALVEEAWTKPQSDNYLKERRLELENTLNEIKTIRWTEEPGERRFKRLLKTVNAYISREIDYLKTLPLSPSRKKEIESAREKLLSLKDPILHELEESFKKEKERMEKAGKKTQPPVPSVDASPFEEKPAGTRGIWER